MEMAVGEEMRLVDGLRRGHTAAGAEDDAAAVRQSILDLDLDLDLDR